MSIESTLAYCRVAAFYYLVGGLTFLPLALSLFLAWFYLTAPVYQGLAESATEPLGDVDLNEERKREALDLAVSNAEALQLAEQNRDKEEAIGTSTAPASAKRLKPAPTPAPRPHRSSWLVIRRQFHSDVMLTAQQQSATSQDPNAATVGTVGAGDGASLATGRATEGERGPGYMSSLYRGMLNYRNARAADQIRRKGTGSSATRGATPSELAREEKQSEKRGETVSNSGSAASSASSKQATGTGGRESFYCILKGPVLYLYSSDDTSNSTTECHAAIDLRSKRVSLFISGVGDTIGEPDEEEEESEVTNAAHQPLETESSTTSEAEGLRERRTKLNWRKAKRATVRDGELFTKRNAVRIVSTAGINRSDEKRRFAQWFVFCKSATLLEDWYHALLHASMLPETGTQEVEDPVGPVFSPLDMVNLLTSLDTLPDPIPLRWLNALVGRVFFSIYRTAWLEDYVRRKIMKKMSRVRTPGFLSDIRVQEIDLGRTPPAFSKPMLKSLTGTGEASMEVAIHYAGSLRLTISTVLTISLGSRFKPYNVPLVLAVIVNSLEGNLLLHIKPPPSNRIWFGFTKLPKMDISVEPVVSERKVQWGMVKKLIEGRIRELLTESLVVPNMDDISFFDSRPLANRGGIWADASKRPDRTSATAAATAAAEGAPYEQKAKSTPASVVDMPVSDAEGKSTSAASGSGLPSDIKRRTRHAGEGSWTPTADSASPAAAGLSTLLARDMARDQTQSEGSDVSRPPSSQSGANRRRSWFVGRSNTVAPGAPLSNTPLDHKRAGHQQSSLAWGNASLSMPTAGDAVIASQSAPTSSLDVPIQDTILFDTSTGGSHEKNKDSISSLETSANSSVGSADTDEVHSGLAAAMGEHAEQEDDELKTPMRDTINGSHAREGTEGNVSNDSELTEADTADGDTAVPVSISPGLQSDDGEAGEAEMVQGGKESDSALAKAPRIPSHGFAPPPSRRATIRQEQQSSLQPSTSDQQRRTSPSSSTELSTAAARLSALQRDRYGLSPRPREDDNASARSANTSSAALLSTWNKAKASMADKDSRQAAARDAKDALRRGWASWNARRNDLQAGDQLEHIPTSSDRLGESSLPQTNRSRTSSWLASSPPDPASLGVGFEPTMRFEGRESRASAAGGDADDMSSRASSTSGREPYKDHRASKERGQRPSSRASSTTRSGTNTPPISAAWDASVPSVATPVPAARRDISNGSATSSQQLDSHLSSSPSSIRKWSAGTAGSPGKTEAGTGRANYSFAPSQGQATTSLSGTDLTELTGESSLAPQAGEVVKLHSSTQTTAPEEGVKTAPATEAADITALPSATPAALLLREGGTMSESLELSVPEGGEHVARRLSASSASKTPSTGIKQQPTRAAMMAVPGIPSTHKTGPQSFSAVPEPTSNATKQKGGSDAADEAAKASSSPRLALGNIISRMPSFGTPNASTSSIEEPQQEQAAKRRLPPLPSQPLSSTPQHPEQMADEPSNSSE